MNKTLRIATWNVNSLRVRLPHVLTWLSDHRVDILALQETKVPDADFPQQALLELGYKSIFAGQKTYNGVAFLTAGPVADVATEMPASNDPQRRFLAATMMGVRVINVYVPNGENPDSPKFQYKMGWLAKLIDYVRNQLRRYPNLVVLGDFNIAPEARDVYDPDLWQGKVLFSDAERSIFTELLSTGLLDALRIFEQAPGHYSWWDYRMNAFRRKLGLRIDHILVSQAMRPQCRSCIIDEGPRAWERPSDHAPVRVCFEPM